MHWFGAQPPDCGGIHIYYRIPGDVLSCQGCEGEKSIAEPDPDGDGQLGVHQVQQQHHVVRLYVYG